MELTRDQVSALWNLVRHSHTNKRRKYEDRWLRNLDLYLGHHWPEDSMLFCGRRVTVNYTAAGIVIKQAAQTLQPPKFNAQIKPGYTMLASWVKVLIGQITEEDFIDSGAWDVAQAVRFDAGIFGIGISHLLYEPGEEEPKPRDEEDDDALEQGRVEASVAEQHLEMMMTPGVDAAALPPPTVEEEFDVFGEGARDVRVSPFDFLWDQRISHENFHRGRFAGRVTRANRSEIEAAFPKAKKLKLGEGRPRRYYGGELDSFDPVNIDDEDDDLNDRSDEADPPVTLYDVYFRRVEVKGSFTVEVDAVDPETGETYTRRDVYGAGEYPLHIVWATEQPEKPLLVELWPFNPRDRRKVRLFPFSVLINREVPGELVGQSDCEIGEDQQLEMNLHRSVMATHARQNMGKLIVDKSILTADTIKQLDSDAPMALVTVDLSKAKTVNPITPMPPVSISQDTHALATLSKVDQSELTGVSDAERGGGMTGPDKTAREAEIIAAKSSVRGSKDDAKFEAYLTEKGNFLWQMRREKRKFGDVLDIKIPQDGLSMHPLRPDGPEPPTMGAPGPPMPMGGPGMGQLPPGMPDLASLIQSQPEMMGQDQAPKPGQIMSATLEDEHLVPAVITMVTGTTREQDRKTKQEAWQAFLQMVGMVYQMVAAGIPINAQYVLDSLAEMLDIGDADQILSSAQFQPPPPPGSQQPGPKPPSESLNYKDAPPDVQRQIEAQAGLQPSQIHPVDLAALKAGPQPQGVGASPQGAQGPQGGQPDAMAMVAALLQAIHQGGAPS